MMYDTHLPTPCGVGTVLHSVRSPVRSTRVTVHGIGYLVRKCSMAVHDKSAHAYEVYGSLSLSNKKPMYGLKQHTTKQPYLKWIGCLVLDYGVTVHTR